MELVGGESVINRATPSSLQNFSKIQELSLLLWFCLSFSVLFTRAFYKDFIQLEAYFSCFKRKSENSTIFLCYFLKNSEFGRTPKLCEQVTGLLDS